MRDARLGAERDRRLVDDDVARRFIGARVVAARAPDGCDLTVAFGSERHEERDIVRCIAVGVDADAIHGVRMEVGAGRERVDVEHDHRARRIARLLEQVEICNVESRIALREREVGTIEMIGHDSPLPPIDDVRI